MSAKQAQAKPLLEVQNLTVSFAGRDAATVAVRGLSYSLNPAETLAIVGESGSGKTQSVMSLIGLLPENGRVAGTANFAGRNLLALSSAELNSLRGKDIAMIFQDPMTALNPYLTIGRQMALVVNRHLHQAGATAAAVCLNMLDAVRIPEPKQRLSQYPHELSGGMRQRVMIATALLCQPKLLIADEPTTALDVTVQAQILELLRELQAEFSTAMLLITHDMGVVAGNCERVLVMAHGECVETGAVNAIFHQPQHAYTRSLLAAVPRLDAANTTLNIPANTAPCLSVKDLEVTYELESHAILRAPEKLKALRGVSFELLPGETLGVVGESGCGKSTLARGVLQLIRPSHGNVVLLGESLHKLSARQLRAKRSDMQIIFQDPLASLNPRMTIADILCEPLDTYQPDLSGNAKLERAAEMLRKVGLSVEHLNRYPHEFSGGQCQRIGIARALLFNPKLIVCDEPVSALDVSVQAKVVELLIQLQKELGLSLVFIAHDLAVVRQVSHRVMVMYLGKTVELADRDAIYADPRHPYTQALIAAVPIPDPDIQRSRGHAMLQGDLPSPLKPPAGCAFQSRCPLAEARCTAEEPVLRTVGVSQVACHFAERKYSA
jgi:peptide/nickel transport system ATP-binding protein